MKNILFVSLLMAFSLSSYAQNDAAKTPAAPKPKSLKPKKQDWIVIDLHGSQILRQNGAGVKTKWYSYGITAQLMYDIPIKKSPVGFAIGLSVTNDNYLINKQILRTTDGGSTFADFTAGKTVKSYKLSTTVLELPIEFRIRFQPHRRNTIKFVAGAKIGYVIQSKTKYRGDGIQYGTEIPDAKIKEYNIPGMNPLRYGVYTRIGWSRFAVTCQYTISEMFRSGKGPEGWHPITLGVTVMPF
jgi:hypothetical protein